jgi:hypothetical protein
LDEVDVDNFVGSVRTQCGAKADFFRIGISGRLACFLSQKGHSSATSGAGIEFYDAGSGEKHAETP